MQQVVEGEIDGRQQHFQAVCRNGEKVKLEAVHASKAIGLRIVTLQERWKKLNKLYANRKQSISNNNRFVRMCVYRWVYLCIQVVGNFFVSYSYKTLYYADANEAESWMKQKNPTTIIQYITTNYSN